MFPVLNEKKAPNSRNQRRAIKQAYGKQEKGNNKDKGRITKSEQWLTVLSRVTTPDKEEKEQGQVK